MNSASGGSGGTSTSSVVWETAALTLLRSTFFVVASRYVNVSLFVDLRSVSEDSTLAAPLESPSRGAIALEEIDDEANTSNGSALLNLGPSIGTSSHAGGAGGGASAGTGTGGTGNNGASNTKIGISSALPQSPTVRTKRLGTNPPRKESSAVLPSGTKGSSSAVYTRSATALFCLAFSESSMLFTLLLFGDAVSDRWVDVTCLAAQTCRADSRSRSRRARTLNWSISLLALLGLIVFVIPLAMCVLLANRTKSSKSTFTRTLVFVLLPFMFYLVAFNWIGWYIASKIVVEGSTSLGKFITGLGDAAHGADRGYSCFTGVVNNLLSKICVPGVFLIAALSGLGAINTAWESYEWRMISSSEAVTEAQVLSAERSLYRTRLDLQQRLRALQLAEGSAAREAESAAGQSLLSRWTSKSPAAAHLKSLQTEVGALESIEGAMTKGVETMKRRKQMREMGRSFRGRVWLVAGWLLSVYCVWRVFVSCLNLVFGYSRNPRHPNKSAGPDEDGTDLITSLLARLAILLDVNIDIAVWSRILGLILIASIILANMRSVLASVSRIFRATSTGVSASFMLLFLAELMAMYLLTSLISLPSTPGSNDTTTSLLDTLPEFSVFSRLFDLVFLCSAALAFVIRFVDRKLKVEDGGSAQYV
ncbi:BZ3500_MvSof-1268-A1-R1_Chr1-3g01792 [Microbotryum saponariae]|uniref:BZ3500_MvSof-1268-A1-R1_Chr1-3g01792 protein n=1 Tax=Microbotryum saponariae TaxID=289078 RepID=A0A2X0KH00_9BASI|nr:BZ3500_MvSof-1268-A1-R1_Chr1-3g01792 [Microbotryum saponariae]SCZ94581.1 BZ3501_MvSof-1269-A2-R1_Chr1-3g01394 [Microbotryum saponariae]